MYWADIRFSATKITAYTANMNESDLSGNDLVRDAVLRNLEIIGEAAKFIPENIRQITGIVEWRRVIGFRNIVAHAYFGIDPSILWNIISDKIPELLSAMDRVELSRDYLSSPGAS
jgi:uncharacterized protein with HEPN domain